MFFFQKGALPGSSLYFCIFVFVGSARWRFQRGSLPCSAICQRLWWLCAFCCCTGEVTFSFSKLYTWPQAYLIIIRDRKWSLDAWTIAQFTFWISCAGGSNISNMTKFDHPGASDPLPDPAEGRGRPVHPLWGQEDQPRPRLLGQLLHEREADRPSA